MDTISKIGVLEPRVDLDNHREWAILKGGSTVTPMIFPAQSYSNSNINWNIICPSKQAILDRVCVVHLQVTLTFAGTTTGGTNNLLQDSVGALRANAIQRAFSNLSVNVNGQTASLEPQQMIWAMERIRDSLAYKQTFGSIRPQMLDNYASYNDAFGANNNPLGNYRTNSAENPRGAYRMTVTSNTTTAAVVVVDLYDYLMLPPLLWGDDGCGRIREAGGLTMLDTFTVSATMNQSLQRIWSSIPLVSLNTATLSSLTVNISANPELHLWWITPRLTENIPMAIPYPFFSVQRYTTVGVTTLAPNASATVSSQVIQFQSVPLKLYIFARRADSDIYSTLAKTISATDTFAKINSIAINFNNVAGILSQASPAHLYEMSLQNGLNMSWDEFNGYTQLLATSGSPSSSLVGTTGSLLVIDPSKDFGLDSTLA